MTENRFDEAICWLNEAMEYGEERHNAPYEEAIQALEEIEQYRAIGTIEEFKALREKNEPKKINNMPMDDMCLYYENHCPNCDSMLVVRYKHCPKCGQKLDWSE